MAGLGAGDELRPMTKASFLIQIGARVRAARDHANLTQEELADRAKVDKDTLSLIERGSTFPSLRSLVNIAESLEIDVIDFIPPAPDQKKRSARVATEARIRELLRDADDKKLQLVHDLIAVLVKA